MDVITNGHLRWVKVCVRLKMSPKANQADEIAGKISQKVMYKDFPFDKEHLILGGGKLHLELINNFSLQAILQIPE